MQRRRTWRRRGERRKKKAKRGGSTKTRPALCRLPGNLPVVYLVTQVGNWGTGSDDVGVIQSTKAPKGRPNNSPVVYLVTQVGNLGTGSDDMGLIQSTKAPPKGTKTRRKLIRSVFATSTLCWARRFRGEPAKVAVSTWRGSSSPQSGFGETGDMSPRLP